MDQSRGSAYYTLSVLFAVNAVNFFDRLILGAVAEPVRKEFGLSDSSLGLLATAFTLFYAVAGLPLGRLADVGPRKYILAAGVFLWSLLTAGTGLARVYWHLFVIRLGVGVGEAACAPAATSLIADLFKPEHRAKALSVFMLGLPVGIGLSFAVSGSIAQAYGWRTAFLAAGLPGVVLAAACLVIREPDRIGAVGTLTPVGAYRIILQSSAMKLLILSGIVHNFCLYTFSSFMTPFMMRHHGLTIQEASFNSMLINGVFTLPGLLFGGMVGDAVRRRRSDAGVLLAATAALAAVPLFWTGINASPTSTIVFVVGVGGGFALMYFYYANVYAAIQDLVPPETLGSAMAIYFFAMYLLGGALGPFITGSLSDFFTGRAAVQAGVSGLDQAALEPFRAAGLQSAMYIMPILCIALALILFAAARAVRGGASPSPR